MINVCGFPCFPGRVSGELCRATQATGAGQIALVTQAELDSLEEGWVGIVVSEGAPFSHALIRVLAFGVPTLLIRADAAAQLPSGTRVLLDADQARLTLGEVTEPPAQPLVIPPPGKPVLTRDGVAVSLRASVRSAAAARLARQCGAEAIGLVRSEFLSPASGEAPDTAFYRAAIAEIVEAAAPLPVTVRLLDVSCDKQPDWLPQGELHSTLLGLQGTRLYHLAPVSKILQAQLAALEQLGAQSDLSVLLPYLTRREELSHWVAEIRRRLPGNIAIGAMVETPAGALEMHDWFDLVDFVAIGCNDLMQCLFAADRDQPAVRHYLDAYAPLLFRFLRQLAEASAANRDRIQLCGVLPQLPGVLPLLIGLGYRAFSVEPRQIPHLAQGVAQTDSAEAARLAATVCAARESRQVRDLLSLPSIESNYV